MRFVRSALLGASPLLLLLTPQPVLSHATGRESRRAADCQKLPSPERQACTACITRPLKHHYHPDYPPGNRCRIDNGKP